MSSPEFLQRRPTRSPDFASQEVDGELVLVPVAMNAPDRGAIYTANEIGIHIWGLLDGNRTLGEVLDRVTDEFDVDREKALKDLQEFIEQLEQIGAVERRDGGTGMTNAQ
jgi:hypothetical protein